jgi:transposase
LNDNTDEFQSEAPPPQDPERRDSHEKTASSVAPQKRMFEAETIQQCVNQGLKQKTAAQMLGLSVRQVQRKVHDYKNNGLECLLIRPVSTKPANALSAEQKEEIIELCKTTYFDVGPLQTSEYLLERHGIKISKETLRKILIETGLWKGKKAQVSRRRARERRSCFGEMLQIDSSLHPWLGDNEPPFWLVNCIDDATGRINGLFFDADSAETNMACLKAWCELYGVPLSIYSDRASHFTPNPSKGKDASHKGETQIQRAFRELSIEQILARSAPAKGRVERCFNTLQDRLVVGLRVNNVKTKEAASEFLENKFIPRFNEKFAVKAKSELNAHRPKDSYNLDAIFSIHEERVVMNDNTFRLDGKRRQIDLRATDPVLVRSKVVIEKRLNGRMAVRRGNIYLKFHLFHE